MYAAVIDIRCAGIRTHELHIHFQHILHAFYKRFRHSYAKGAGHTKQTGVVIDDHIVIPGGKLELETIRIHLAVQFFRKLAHGEIQPARGVLQLRVQNADLGQAVHFHNKPVAGTVVKLQPVAVLPHGLVPIHQQVIRKGRALIEREQSIGPVRSHADAALDGTPAQGVTPGHAILWNNSLLHPAFKHTGKGLGVLFITGQVVLVGQQLPLVVAAELPGPLLIAVIGGVHKPIYLPLKLMGHTHRDKVQVGHTVCGLLLRLSGKGKVVFRELIGNSEKSIRIQSFPHMGGEQPAAGGIIPGRSGRRDPLQPGQGAVHQFTKETGICQLGTNHIFCHINSSLSVSAAAIPPFSASIIARRRREVNMASRRRYRFYPFTQKPLKKFTTKRPHPVPQRCRPCGAG